MQYTHQSAHLPTARRQSTVLVLLLTFTGFFTLIASQQAFNLTTEPDSNAEIQDTDCGQLQKKWKPSRCSTPGDQVIYIPLVDLPEARDSELVFNSRSPKELEVTPTFYKRDGTIVQADRVRVKSAEIRFVRLKKLLPERYRGDADFGGLSLAFHGTNREMWAQLRFLGVNGGNSVDEFFVVKNEQRSILQEAAWWMPQESTAIIALGNLTDTPTSAIVEFSEGSAETISLAPHATEIVRHQRLLEGSESVSIMTEVPGSVGPTGIITSRNGVLQ
jgi:hypothetical protein